MTLLGTVETKILTLLDPLLITNGGELKAISVEEFKTEEALGELIQRFRPQMPAGFLSTPSGVLEKAAGPRVLDARLEYRFLVGLTTRRSTKERRDAAFQIFDHFCQLLSLRQIGRQGLATTSPPDFVRVTLVDYADSNEIAALLVGFSIAIRNWQINEPA